MFAATSPYIVRGMVLVVHWCWACAPGTVGLGEEGGGQNTPFMGFRGHDL